MQFLRDGIGVQARTLIGSLVLALLDWLLEHLLELALFAQKTVIAEPVHQAPDLHQIVLQWCARENNPMIRVHAVHALRHFRVAVPNLC